MNAGSDTALVAYIASPHDGYLQLFRHYAGSRLWVLGDEFIAEFPELTKHLPGNKPEDARRMVAALEIFSSVEILTPAAIADVRRCRQVVLPEENVSHAIAKRHFVGMNIVFDGRWRLRWYKDSVVHGWHPTGVESITTDELHRQLMGEANAAAKQSPDWWRQVGALLVRDGTVLIAACNRHRPAEQSCYLYGDPRSCFGPGEHIELSAAGHAERAVASAALKRGICTEGCDLYVTTFPCPGCAYEWAETGIRRLFYADGYSLVDGAADLRAHGVEIIRVLFHTPLPSG